MPSSHDLKETLSRAQVTKLKALGTGIKVDKVMGERLLIKLVHSFTDMDRVEKEGLLHIPKTAKDANQPLPSTGIVVQLGEELQEAYIVKYGINRPISDPDNTPWPIEPGSMVMFSRFSGTDFRVDEEQFRILDINEVMCTLTDTQGVVAPVAEE